MHGLDVMMEEIEQRQQFFDQFCAAWWTEYRLKGGQIYCANGCSGCCSLVVNCSLPEALRVAGALGRQHYTRLAEWAGTVLPLADQANNLKNWLSGYRQAGIRCPFLDESGSCSVYRVRPLSCRSLLATREPVWCTTDFSALSADQKQAFMAELDRSSVAFPTHYAATPQELGQELEEATLRQMESVYGFSMLGCLPWLVWAELQHGISSWLQEGRESVEKRLQDQGLLQTFLAVLT